eukprot:666025-Amphidinium_carterae.1
MRCPPYGLPGHGPAGHDECPHDIEVLQSGSERATQTPRRRSGPTQHRRHIALQRLFQATSAFTLLI